MLQIALLIVTIAIRESEGPMAAARKVVELERAAP
jgi:hypothetical protein